MTVTMYLLQCHLNNFLLPVLPIVSSWEGGRSGLDEELDRDARNERKRDTYDQEFDRGKVRGCYCNLTYITVKA